MNAVPTPTPWRARNAEIFDADGVVIAEVAGQHSMRDEDCLACQNAAFIVRVANVHEELLEACREQHKALDHLMALLVGKDDSFFPTMSAAWPAAKQGLAAIKNAEAA